MTQAHSDAFVFFGATGDLAYKQIFPSLYKMVQRDGLAMPIIGVAKAGWNLDKLRERAHDSLKHAGAFDDKVFEQLSGQLQYVDGDYSDPATFAQLRRALGATQRPIHYLAVPPSLFGTVAQGLAKSGSAKGARVIVEKPFGRDLASAQALNATMHEVFPEDSIFRIDHYLGKEAVQNLQYFRFANSFLDPIWNRQYVKDVQLTMAESFGVQGRGAFYEEVGALRDVVQNHLLQVIALLAMEAPQAHDPQSLQMEKLRLFRAMRPLDPNEVIRGQFNGYKSEKGVAADSQVETFVALRLHIDNWRWAGVPFYIRAGKSLPVTATEVVVSLKPPPLTVFDNDKLPGNYFRFKLSPDVVISLGALVKHNGEAMCGSPVELIARHPTQDEKSPYERLLSDAIRGDRTLFTQDDSVEAAWSVVEPILKNPSPVVEYDPGSWGPRAAVDIIAGDDAWHDPQIDQTPP